MNNTEIALSRFVVNKVWEVAQTCVEEGRKGWFVTMQEFRDAMDSLDFTSEEVGAALAYLELRTCLLAFRNEEGHITGISLGVPGEFCTSGFEKNWYGRSKGWARRRSTHRSRL